VNLAEINRAYALLGLEVGTPLKECGEAWRRLSKEWHPDLHEPGSDEWREAVEMQKQINQAYDLLKRTDVSQLPKPKPKPVHSESTSGGKSAEQLYEEGRQLENACKLFEAMDIYKRLGHGGYVKAQFRLGYLYYDSIVKDLAQALYWWKRAADQGHVLAAYNLGLMYEKGHGVAADPATALTYFMEAAKRGDAKAAEKVGMVKRGMGMLGALDPASVTAAPQSGIYKALTPEDLAAMSAKQPRVAEPAANGPTPIIPPKGGSSEQAGRAFIHKKKS
jgi:hypothetical protein